MCSLSYVSYTTIKLLLVFFFLIERNTKGNQEYLKVILGENKLTKYISGKIKQGKQKKEYINSNI